MSTIASAREPSLSGRRIPLLSTPTSSSRPSLDTTRSDSSPSRTTLPSSPSNYANTNTNRNTNTSTPQPLQPKRNRTALREYYNLQKGTPSSLSTASQAPSSPASSSIHSNADDDRASAAGNRDRDRDGAESEMDNQGFDAAAYVQTVLEEKSLGEVLGIYRGVLADVRALDAERKALVYDNYSKLIAATEMIGRMREGVGESSGGGGGAATAAGKAGGGKTGEGVVGVQELVERVRRGVEALRGEDGATSGPGKEDIEKAERRRKTRSVVERVLGTPERVRGLVKEGKTEEARAVWENEKKLLERWRERGVGGPDVGECIEDGERALRGEDPVDRVESKP